MLPICWVMVSMTTGGIAGRVLVDMVVYGGEVFAACGLKSVACNDVEVEVEVDVEVVFSLSSGDGGVTISRSGHALFTRRSSVLTSSAQWKTLPQEKSLDVATRASSNVKKEALGRRRQTLRRH